MLGPTHFSLWQEGEVIEDQPDGFIILCKHPQLSLQPYLSRPLSGRAVVSLSHRWGRQGEKSESGTLVSFLD